MPRVFDLDGNGLPDLVLTAAKRRAIQAKIAAFLSGIESRINPWVYVSFNAAGRHCEVYLKRDASANGFSEAWITVGQSDFDVLVRA